jgi:S1-C subfamily serine protease
MTEYPLPPQPEPQPESGFPAPAGPMTEPQHPGHRGRRRAIVAGIGALAVVGGAVGIGVAATRGRTVQGTGTVAAGSTILPRWGAGLGPNGSGGANGSGSNGYGSGGWDFGGFGGSTNGGSNGYGNGSSGTGAQQQATAAQQVGVVDIDTVLGYQNAEAAGTGTVVTTSGEVLTNNHVIDGATKITVTVVSTGKTYTAQIVGTDPTEDVAVLQLVGASGLQTAHYGDDDGLAIGDSVTGVGNAGGVGGTPSAAEGKITALNKSITASDEGGGNAERLTGLIETDADIQSGDSGGPLYDSSGEIIGMDTAASTTGTQTTAGYAIPIEHALAIADRIESATASTSTIHLGNPAVLGVSVEATGGQGAGVAHVVTGTSAARAGLAAGDTITAVDGVQVRTPAALVKALGAHRPGDSVTIAWTDASGKKHTARVTLASGPAD